MHSELLLRLSSADAIAGDEGEVRTLIKEALGNFAGEIFFDGLGSMVFHLPPAVKTEHAPKLLFCAHMDEVGLMVHTIADDGYLKFAAVGGIDRRVLIGKRVLVPKDKLIAWITDNTGGGQV